MAILTKAQLEALNQASFPDQSTEAITPAILRTYNTQTIDTLVNSLDTGSFTTDGEFNAFTSSTNSSLTQLNASSASQQSSINALNGATSSYVSSNITASSLITASVNLNTITFTKGNGSTFDVTVNTGSGGGGTTDITALNAFTASQIGINSGLNASSASQQISINNLNSTTASLNSSITNLNSTTASINSSITQLNASSASQQISIDALNAATASYVTSAITASSLITASVSGQTMTFTKGNGTTFDVTLPAGSGSTTIPTGTVSSSAQITALGFVSSSVTASSLITASVNLNTITFTKGDASTFNITVNTGSGGGTTDISSLNAFTASQETKDITLANVTSSLNSATASLFASASLGLTTASFSGNTLTFTKGNGTTFGVVIPDVSGSGVPTGTISSSAQIVELGFLQTSSFNSYTSSTNSSITQLNASSASQQISINALNAATSSYVTSAITASSLVTASFSVNTLTFTKGDGTTFGVVIPDVSGSTINTGSFATTGSNAFFGTNSFSGAVSFTGSAPSILSQSFSGSLITNLTDVYTDVAAVQQIVTLTSASYAALASGSLTNPNTLYIVSGSTSGSGSTTIPAGTISGSQQITALGFVSSSVTASSLVTASFSGNTLTFTKGDSSTFGVVIPDVSGSTIDTGSFVTTSSFNAYTSSVTESVVTAIVTNNGSNYYEIDGIQAPKLSFVPGPTYRFDLSGIAGNHPFKFSTTANGPTEYTTGVTSGSNFIQIQVGYNTTTPLYYYCTNHSGMGNEINVLAIDTLVTTASFNAYTASVTTINTGSFATTGSNTFIGDETFQDGSGNGSTLSPYSGSIVFVSKGVTSGSVGLSNITSSANLVNLIFKNSNANSGSLVLSGSNNILLSPASPTAGFRRQVTTNNIFLTTALPEVTGSLTYSPTINGNYGNSVLRFRGPASSSAWSFNNNILNGNFNVGNSDSTPANQAIAGGNMGNNILLSGVNYNAYTTPLVTTANFGQNLCVGNSTLTAFSSSIQANFNIFNGNTFTVNNRYFGTSSTNAAQRLGLQYNVFGGVNTPTLTAEGSNTTAGAPREVIGNTTNGSGVSLGVVLSGDNSNLYSTLVHGSNLTVTGSSAYNTYQTAGGAFIGRNNDRNGTRANSGETVFAVGTGTNGGLGRKTGFLIDSSSNTFIEGTLNVSGSTSFNGAVNITGSLTSSLTEGFVLVGGVGNISTLVATSSFGGGSVPAGTVSSSAQILGYNIFATTGSNTFNNVQTIRSSGGLSFTETIGGGGSDNYINLASANQSTLYIQNVGVSTGYQSGSVLQLTTSTGSNGFGFSGSATFQMDAVYEGKTAKMQVSNINGVGTSVLGFAERIEFAKVGGFPNTPADTFRVDAASIELSGSVKVNTGSSGSAGIVNIASGGTVNNGLVTSNSIILVTTQQLGAGDEYPAVVSGKTAGSFEIHHNYGSNLNVAYLIINPIT